MSRLTGKGAGSLANAYASIYEAKKEEMKGGDCTAASKRASITVLRRSAMKSLAKAPVFMDSTLSPTRTGL